MKPVIQHLDTALARLASDASFARRLEYVADTHSFENWLRTEIAYEISKRAYEARPGAPYWSHPEKHGRVDIPIISGRAKRPCCLVELKVLYNRRGFGKANRRMLAADTAKLREMECGERVLLAALVLMKYTHPYEWPARTRLRNMQEFMEDTFAEIPNRSEPWVRFFDATVQPFTYRPEFAVRLCRVRLPPA